LHGSELLTSTFADAIALHERVKNGETQVVLDAAAAISSSPTSGASSAALKAMRAFHPAPATGNAGLPRGLPSTERSTDCRRAPFTSYKRTTSKPSGHHASQRALLSAPDSQGWQSCTSPEGRRRRSRSRNRRPRRQRSSSSGSRLTPERSSAAAAWPYMGGWVIEDVPGRPQNPACTEDAGS